jgi:hypothetical protein
VTVPANYDAVTLAVEPGPLMMGALMVQDAVQDVGNALTAIDNTLNGLQLGWDGTTAAEAQDFNTQWQAAMRGLFGTDQDPKSGVMNQVIIALMTAVGDSSNAENSIVQMMAALQAALTAGALSNSSPTTPIAAGTGGTFDMSLTAITEINFSGTP